MQNNQEIKSFYTVKELRELSNSDIINNIKFYLQVKLNQKSFSESQLVVWNKSIDLIKSIFEKDNKNWNILFEFLIPLSSGKRPDILLTNGVTIFLIEVKNKSNYTIADLDQIEGYKLDLMFYHSIANKFEVRPILLLLEAKSLTMNDGDITILSPDNLKSVLLENYQEYLMVHPVSLNEGNFKPVPSIIEYAKLVFENKEIPQIEKSCFLDSSEISLDLNAIYAETKSKKEHSIVFLTGTPGSGKSALGLKCAFNNGGLYVTKNRQFAENLNDEIGVNSNVKTNHNLITEYCNNQNNPFWNLVVFDEAQRFWNKDKMSKYFDVNDTESQFIIDLFEGKDWAVLVVLVGYGQELGWGENCKFSHWKDAIFNSIKKWNVYGTNEVIQQIGSKKNKVNCIEKQQFDLSHSFRNFKAPFVPVFVNKLLDFRNDLDSSSFIKLKNEYLDITNNGFKIIITRTLDSAIKYCESRYQNRPNSYCILTSSESNINEIVEPDFKNTLVYDYQESSRLSINNYLNNNGVYSESSVDIMPLSEYSAIGFEMQMPILAWGLDYTWYKNRWNYDMVKYITGNKIGRQNTYRILLTRGRDGVILYFPPIWELDKTFQFFKALGATII